MTYRLTFADRIGGESVAGWPAPRKASRFSSPSQRSKTLIRRSSSGSAACTKSRLYTPGMGAGGRSDDRGPGWTPTSESEAEDIEDSAQLHRLRMVRSNSAQAAEARWCLGLKVGTTGTGHSLQTYPIRVGHPLNPESINPGRSKRVNSIGPFSPLPLDISPDLWPMETHRGTVSVASA